jgi:hypothetical protein
MFNAKRSVMYAWIVSYIIIFFIPVIVSTSIYPFSRNMLEKQINDANQTLLNQVQYAIDGRLQDIEKIAYEITTNSAVKGLHYLNSDADKSLQYNVVMQYLRGYKMTNSWSRLHYDQYRRRYCQLASGTAGLLLPTLYSVGVNEWSCKRISGTDRFHHHQGQPQGWLYYM